MCWGGGGGGGDIGDLYVDGNGHCLAALSTGHCPGMLPSIVLLQLLLRGKHYKLLLKAVRIPTQVVLTSEMLCTDSIRYKQSSTTNEPMLGRKSLLLCTNLNAVEQDNQESIKLL